MNTLLCWLSKRRSFTCLLVVGYLIAVSLGHKQVSNFFDWIRAEFSFRVYDSVMLDIGVILLFLFSLIILDRIRRDRNRRTTLIAWWCFTTALVVGSYEVLIVFSVETIHFLQYAIMAVPVFALTMSFGETVGWVTLMGALDEAYQYFVIYAGEKTVYFDFNDIILNLVGAGMGVLMIYTLSDLKSAPFDAHSPARSRLISPSAALIASVAVVGFLLHLSGIVELYPEASASGSPLVVLSRKLAPARFWLKPDVGKSFHILSAAQGILTGLVLVAGYSVMDICVGRERDPSTDWKGGRRVQ